MNFAQLETDMMSLQIRKDFVLMYAGKVFQIVGIISQENLLKKEYYVQKT